MTNHHHKTKRVFTGPLHREGTPVVGLWIDKDHKCLRSKEFGVIDSWSADQQGCHPVEDGRNCVHRFKAMPRSILFGEDLLRELHHQPTTLTQGGPVIAKRVNHGVVMLGFDVVGQMEGCTNKPNGVPEKNRWYYRLYPIRFTDHTEATTDHILLGVRIDRDIAQHNDSREVTL